MTTYTKEWHYLNCRGLTRCAHGDPECPHNHFLRNEECNCNPTQPNTTIDGEVGKALEAYKAAVIHEYRFPIERNVGLSKLTQTITNLIAQEANKAVVAELEKIVDWDVPASYEQDGKNWQGLAIPRNLIRKRIAQLTEKGKA